MLTGILTLGLCNFGGRPIISAPVITSAGTISGAVIGSVASVSGFAYDGSPAEAPAYQWKLDGADITGATAATYAVAEADDGGALTCAITVTNSAGTDTATTPAVTVAYAAPAQSGPFVAALTQNSAGSIDYAARVTVSGDADLSGVTWSVQSGTVPAGMTRTGGVVSGTPTSTQSVAALVLRATNSGGFVDVSCDVSVAATPPEIVSAETSQGPFAGGLVAEVGQTMICFQSRGYAEPGGSGALTDLGSTASSGAYALSICAIHGTGAEVAFPYTNTGSVMGRILIEDNDGEFLFSDPTELADHVAITTTASGADFAWSAGAGDALFTLAICGCRSRQVDGSSADDFSQMTPDGATEDEARNGGSLCAGVIAHVTGALAADTKTPTVATEAATAVLSWRPA